MNIQLASALGVAAAVACISALPTGCDATTDTEPTSHTDQAIESTRSSRSRLTGDELFEEAKVLKIATVDDFLRMLPDYMRESYVFMQKSRSLQMATVEQPRAILFGTDARLLLGISSVPSDPLYSVVEMLQLDPVSGEWHFRTIDFRGSTPVMASDPPICRTCHGHPARPIWGQYDEWPGAFGDSGGTLTQAQAATLRNITQDPSQRFNALIFDIPDLQTGHLYLPNRIYSYPNTDFNLELGSAVPAGIDHRLRSNPRYPALRPAILWADFCEDEVEPTYQELGIVGGNDFALDQFATQTSTEDDFYWDQGSAYLKDLVAFLVLNDMANADPAFLRILQPIEAKREELFHDWWQVLGAERQAFLASNAYLSTYDIRPVDLVAPVQGAMCRYLRTAMDNPGP